MAANHAIIVHGWEGYPEEGWFPWLKQQLETKGFTVDVPAMPNADHPKLSEWLPHLQQTAGNDTSNLILIGHSLGGITILRFLEALPAGQTIKGAVLVAGFSQSIGLEEVENFFDTPLNYEKVKESAEQVTVIHSDNDEYVPLKQGEIMRDKLGAKLIVIPNADHFSGSKGFTKLPIALESTLQITNSTS